MSVIKKLKVKSSDSYGEDIPLGANAINITFADGSNLEDKILDAGGSLIPIKGVTNITAISQDGQATIKWTDPEDTIIEDWLLAKWVGTKIVIKENDYPTSIADGKVVLDSTTRNQYQTNPYIITNLTNDTKYYGCCFAYSNDGYVAMDKSCKFTVEPGAIYPTAASNINITGNKESMSFSVTFTYPSDATSATIVMKKGEIPANAQDGEVKNNLKNGSAVTFSNIEKNQTYYFIIYTYNQYGRETRSEEKDAVIGFAGFVTFADGTDEQIAAMLEAHYRGDIEISDFWSVGDTRKVQLTNLGVGSTKDGSGTAHTDQLMTMIIIDFNHDDLTTKKGTRAKAAVTVQCKETFGNAGVREPDYTWGEYIATDNDTTRKWADAPYRNWLNTNFINAMPATFGSLVKTVNKKNLTNRITANTQITQEKAFLLSYPEVMGKVTWNGYLNGQDVKEYEGTQYEYCKDFNHNMRYINNNGEPNIQYGVTTWAVRSLGTNQEDAWFGSGKEYEWPIVGDYKGTIIDYQRSFSRFDTDQAPAFCL